MLARSLMRPLPTTATFLVHRTPHHMVNHEAPTDRLTSGSLRGNVVDLADLLQIVIGEDWLVRFQPLVLRIMTSAQQIRAWSYTVAHYCLEKNKVLEHGQAVGISPKEWIRTWIVSSRLEPGSWAIWLDLEAEE